MAQTLTLLILLVTSLYGAVNAILPLSVVGSKFFTSNGSQFFMKGIAYQLTEDDPLVNTTQCQLDAALMQELGANAIRVYHVDPTADHSGCMSAFAAVGIYLFVDCDSFKTYIRSGSESSWTQNKSDAYRAVVDNFQQFENTAGFLVGNEVLNSVGDAQAAPFLLSAAVDLKAYIAAKGYRKIPIGYSATDTAVLRPMLQNYLVCRPNPLERLDYYALNSYEWCGSTPTYETSGYMSLQADANNYPVPIFFSEDGCNTVPPRTFNDQAAIFGSEMVETWSGAMIYEWIQELNQYGLVSYGAPLDPSIQEGSYIIQGFTRKGLPTPVQPDFENLKLAWRTLNPTGVKSADYAATYSTIAPPCPSSTAGGWDVDPYAPLPTIGVVGVSPGMPANVLKGSISISNQTAQTSRTYSSTDNPSAASSTNSAGSATAEAAAGRTVSSPPVACSYGVWGMVTALMAVGAGVLFLL